MFFLGRGIGSKQFNDLKKCGEGFKIYRGTFQVCNFIKKRNLAIDYFRKMFPHRCFEAFITFFEGLQSGEENVCEPDFFVALVGSQKDIANFCFSKILGLWT